jgi:hypothetical protein
MPEYNITINRDENRRTWVATSAEISELEMDCDLLDLLIQRVYFAVPELLGLDSEDDYEIMLNYLVSHQEKLVPRKPWSSKTSQNNH